MEIKKMTEAEWRAEGERLFGENTNDWQFICPVCGNIQSINDFKPYKDKGATPSDAYFNCIGRFDGSDNHIGSKKKPCNYTSGGLFCFSPVLIDEKHCSFDFYREKED